MDGHVHHPGKDEWSSTKFPAFDEAVRLRLACAVPIGASVGSLDRGGCRRHADTPQFLPPRPDRLHDFMYPCTGRGSRKDPGPSSVGSGLSLGERVPRSSSPGCRTRSLQPVLLMKPSASRQLPRLLFRPSTVPLGRGGRCLTANWCGLDRFPVHRTTNPHSSSIRIDVGAGERDVCPGKVYEEQPWLDSADPCVSL